jgi:hypothetical protein
VTRAQFEISKNKVVHKPTGARFTAYPGRPEIATENLGRAGGRLENGDDYRPEDVRAMAAESRTASGQDTDRGPTGVPTCSSAFARRSSFGPTGTSSVGSASISVGPAPNLGAAWGRRSRPTALCWRPSSLSGSGLTGRRRTASSRSGIAISPASATSSPRFISPDAWRSASRFCPGLSRASAGALDL